MTVEHSHRSDKLPGPYDRYQSQTPRHFLLSRQPQPTPEVRAAPSPGATSRDGFSPTRFLSSPRFFAPQSTHPRQQLGVHTTVKAEPLSSSPFVPPLMRPDQALPGRGYRRSRAWEDSILTENVNARNVPLRNAEPSASAVRGFDTHDIDDLDIETVPCDVSNDAKAYYGDNDEYTSDIAMESDDNDDLDAIGNINRHRVGISSYLPRFKSESKVQLAWPSPENRARKRRRISISSVRSSSVGSEGIQAPPVAPSTRGNNYGKTKYVVSHRSGNDAANDQGFAGVEHHQDNKPGSPYNSESATCNDVDVRDRIPNTGPGAISFLRYPNRPICSFASLPSFKPEIDRTGSCCEDPTIATVAISPRRRTHARYVADGLASSLQTWLGEANAESVREERASDPSLSDLAIVSARNSSAFTVAWGRGANPSLTETASTLVKTILVRRNKANGIEAQSGDAGRSVFVDPCSVATLRRPTWRVGISGEHWTVGGHWKTSNGITKCRKFRSRHG